VILLPISSITKHKNHWNTLFVFFVTVFLYSKIIIIIPFTLSYGLREQLLAQVWLCRTHSDSWVSEGGTLGGTRLGATVRSQAGAQAGRRRAPAHVNVADGNAMFYEMGVEWTIKRPFGKQP